VSGQRVGAEDARENKWGGTRRHAGGGHRAGAGVGSMRVRWDASAREHGRRAQEAHALHAHGSAVGWKGGWVGPKERVVALTGGLARRAMQFGRAGGSGPSVEECVRAMVASFASANWSLREVVKNLFPNSTNPSTGPSCKKQTCDAHSPKPVVLQVQMLPLRCGARPRKRRNPHETEDSTPSGDTDETKLGVPKRAKEVKSTLSPGLKSASGRTCDSADSAGQGGEDNEDCVRDNDGRASGGSVQATRTLRKCIVGMGCDNLTVCYLRMRW
jgi:hypothetical protein